MNKAAQFGTSLEHLYLLTARMRCYFVKVYREKEPCGAHLFGGSVRGVERKHAFSIRACQCSYHTQRASVSLPPGSLDYIHGEKN